MSTYNFLMRDYHAVKEADIEIAGLTVVSGINGCGKSTIARWLNYVVNGLNNYDKYVIGDARESYNSLLLRLIRASSISTHIRLEWSKNGSSYLNSDNLADLRNSFMLAVERFAALLAEKMPRNMWGINRKRLSSLFDLEAIDGEPLSDFIVRFTEYLNSEGEEIYNTALSRLGSPTIRNWREVLLDRIDLTIDNANVNLSFSEDGVMLLDNKRFSLPLMLRNAVYVNTQEISAAIGPSTVESSDLWRLLQYKSQNPSGRSRVIAKIIRQLIGGDVVVNTSQGAFPHNRDRLHYVRRDGLDILLRGAATGIISFSILLQLLENGHITENTLLIIDEPEAHLHPQWIVEYARVLVKINKLLGTKIFISTHNPDMLAALQSIAANEGTINETMFYLADTDGDTDRYIYRNLNHDIGPIFDSFNIALDRIEQYGAAEPSEE